MKTKNFPAKKLLRQIMAKKRRDGTNHIPFAGRELKALQDARNTRSK